MARIVYSPNALSNIESSFEWLAERAPESAGAAVVAIRTAVDILAHHPLVGRIVTGEYRELVISYGKTGYVALYRFVPQRDVVRILAVRHQREFDYP